MYRLLEKILEEDVTASLSMWLTPKGEEESIGEINHVADATVRLAKLKGEEVDPTSTYNSEVTTRNFYEFMKISGYIRLYLSSFGDELDVTVGGKVTPAQLAKIGKLTREYSKFYWEIVDDAGQGFCEFVTALESGGLMESLIEESSIDFPQASLDQAVWDLEGKIPILREEVKKKILAVLEKYPDVPLLEIAEEIRIVGSIATNQYLDSADLDIHIVPDMEKLRKYLK